MFRRRENNRVSQAELVADLSARVDRLAALVVVGDLVYTGGARRQWRRVDRLLAPISAEVPVLPAIGNHDYHCFLIQFCTQRVVPREFRQRYPWFAPGQVYAVAYGDLLLAFLDSETGLDAQREPLRRLLDEGKERYAAALVFFHRPAYSNSIDLGARGDERIQSQIVPLLEGAGLPVVVFSGHIHGYEHLVINGLNYITTAGGGGPRGLLGADRPNDRYSGPNCETNDEGAVLRPLNYLLVDRSDDALAIEVRGFCRAGEPIRTLDRLRIELATE
jgi:hypothetical protein